MKTAFSSTFHDMTFDSIWDECIPSVEDLGYYLGSNLPENHKLKLFYHELLSKFDRNLFESLLANSTKYFQDKLSYFFNSQPNGEELKAVFTDIFRAKVINKLILEIQSYLFHLFLLNDIPGKLTEAQKHHNLLLEYNDAIDKGYNLGEKVHLKNDAHFDDSFNLFVNKIADYYNKEGFKRLINDEAHLMQFVSLVIPEETRKEALEYIIKLNQSHNEKEAKLLEKLSRGNIIRQTKNEKEIFIEDIIQIKNNLIEQREKPTKLKVAQMLNISKSTFYDRLKYYHIEFDSL